MDALIWLAESTDPANFALIALVWWRINLRLRGLRADIREIETFEW